MIVSAHGVAAAIRDRLPGVPVKKLHQLLYYCQGHHLATFGTPLFDEAISAWDMGPVVGKLWRQEKETGIPAAAAELAEAQLNTIGYVISRYGALTGTDLEHLTHSEAPWQLANSRRRPGGSSAIQHDWLRDYFTTGGAPDGEDDAVADSAAVTEWLKGARDRRSEPARPDTLAEIQARLERSA